MIVISRKRISIIVLSILIGIISFTYKNNNFASSSVKETASTPASGKVIIIDAGHGKTDEGT